MSKMSCVLYSFRRCPYAMRARLAMWASGVSFELREIVLKNKPESMLLYSPKGTVPVLVLDSSYNSNQLENVSTSPQANALVIDESLDIMLWALAQRTSKDTNSSWFPTDESLALIEENDQVFKGWLDKYKYADRFPEHDEDYYRQQGEVFLQKLETLLQQQTYLSGEQFGFLDAAIAPFVRQFAHVKLTWFEQSPYPNLIAWLDTFKSSDLFTAIMSKYPAWSEDDVPLIIEPEVK